MLPSYREMFHLDEDRVASQIIHIVYVLQQLHAHVRPGRGDFPRSMQILLLYISGTSLFASDILTHSPIASFI